MDFKTKVALVFLGALGILNTVADLSFRLAIANDTKASWYVWIIVGITLFVVVASLVSMYLVKKMQKSKLHKIVVVAQDGTGDFNGTTDVPIRQAIESLGDEGGEVVIKPGTYTIKKKLSI
jgi:flagellar basal body-associated protein FliL